MSGLLERIARRRRATASSRLGPPPSLNGTAHPEGGTYERLAAANGGAPPAAPSTSALNGHAPALTPEEPVALEVARWEPQARAMAREVAEPESAEVAEPEPPAEPAPLADLDPPVEPEPPAEPEPLADLEPPAEPPVEPAPLPGFIERGRLRRRARYLRRLREVQLRDIGGFLVELHRFGRERPDLIAAKVEGAATVDSELRALEHALGCAEPTREIREAGIGGACPRCGAVHGSSDRFCAACGAALADDAA